MAHRRTQYDEYDQYNENQQAEENLRRHRPPHRRLKGCFFWVLLTFVVVLLVGGHFAFKKYQTAHSTINTIHQESGIRKVRDTNSTLKKGRPFSILLMGTDTGALGRSYKGRTDTLVLAVLNPKKESMTLVSLPRDTEVAVHGHENQYPSKLNSAYSYDGSASAVQTVQKYLNVPIDYYATIDMGGLENLINAVGGIDVSPALSFSYGGYSFIKGKKTQMNGKKALSYVRMRYSDPRGDYGRQERQRQVLMAVAMKATQVKSLLNEKFLNTVSKQMKTDLSFNNMLLLAAKYRKATHHMNSTHLQGESTMINGESFEVPKESEKQRITDLLRKALDLSSASTGSTLSSSDEININ
ncbi:LCP family protein [Ligilactobacillus pobuzihii]|uniref:LytR family transcriptional regulator n=1 Tax=Ligilactobacillus pobuzihii TaxID=449659 RepID=A0A0R2L9Z1_9LACO|nr:LCP family protein [Ligilactobacillus pobuzihii]KRK09042.1 LytR family transcriptional regulator [Ligilactobacillus pobuzihii E100301 = KCTC 13174]KRN98289.1 LytR family transcriptional regulator [Ligilactobacillus pobuzihii]GEN49274.1 LytR family transcriptional regulator [Ligilactobacillus pobuzihii]